MKKYEFYAYSGFILVSTTSLLPWNLFMNAHEYFHFKLRNSTGDTWNSSQGAKMEEVTDLQKSYEGWVTITSGTSCLIGSLLNFLTTSRISNTTRVITGHLAVLLALLLTIAFTFIQTDNEQQAFFWTSMLLAALASFGSMGFIACGLLGLAARFPGRYVQAVMIGQAVAGIVSSLLSIGCQALTSSAVANGRVFFATAAIWTAMSVVVYAYMVSSTDIAALRTPALTYSDASQSRQLLSDTDENSEDQSSVVNSGDSLQLRNDLDGSFLRSVVAVWLETRLEMIAAFIVLLETLAAFPALSSLVVSNSADVLWKDYFSAVACFLLFNVGDAIGRLISGPLTVDGRTLILWSSLRVLFVPLIFFCNVRPRKHSPTVFVSDGVFIALICLFSVSNGFLYSSASISTTRKANKDLRELTGSLLGVVAIISSLVGSVVGMFLVSLV